MCFRIGRSHYLLQHKLEIRTAALEIQLLQQTYMKHISSRFCYFALSLLNLRCNPLGSHGCSQEASGYAFVANVVSTHGSTEFLLMAVLARMDQQIDTRS